jgi:uncharacterized damage-inducible protein DinB
MAAITTHHLPILLQVLERNRALLARIADGVDPVAARTPLVPDGSHLQWMLGHLVASRDGVLTAVGAERVWSDERAAPFDFGSVAGDTPDEPMTDLLAALATQQERIAVSFAGLDDDALAGPHGRATLGESLEFMVWHETYHLGQATLYRRGAGLPSAIG